MVSCLRSKVPIGSAYPLSSNSAVHYAFLSYHSCFLQLLCRVMFILHTLYLSFDSLTTTSLACSPIASPELSYLLIFTLSDKIILLITILKTSCPLSQAPTRRTMSQGSYTDFVAFSGLRCADVFDFFR